MIPHKQKKARVFDSASTSRSRRTSLNVNLSYVSNTTVSPEDESINSSSPTSYANSDFLGNTVLLQNPAPIIPSFRNVTVRNRSLRRKLSGLNKNDIGNIDEAIQAVEPKVLDCESIIPVGKESESDAKKKHLASIKPAIVSLTRIPVTCKNRKLIESQEPLVNLVPSKNTRLSHLLENVRFPLEGEIFSQSATILVETSMDITEVQGGIVPHINPSVENNLHSHRNDSGSNYDSSNVVQDTDNSIYEESRIGCTTIISETEQDSINSAGTSLNVNTSLDSRFSFMPNSSLYDPKKVTKTISHKHDAAQNHSKDVYYHNSQSSEDNVPTHSVIVTSAVIERKDSSSDAQDTNITGINPESEQLNDHNTLLSEKTKADGRKSHTAGSQKTRLHNDISSTGTWSCEDTGNKNSRLNISDHESQHNNRTPSNDSPSKQVKKKRKLLRLRMSEVVDLSPVSVQIVPGKRPLPKRQRRKRLNKTAKSISDTRATAKKNKNLSESDNDMEEIDPVPKKAKKIRRIKTKKIIIKKIADCDLWNQMNGNFGTVPESCNDISLALEKTSLDDFEPKMLVTRRKNQMTRPKIIIVATGLPIAQKVLLKSVVMTLGSAKLEKIVNRYTTHVVCKGVRTVNMLHGILRGCWLVTFQWISESQKAGKWIDPAKYELTSFSKAVQESRRERKLFGAAYVSELFLTCGLIHIKEGTSTPLSVLKELIRVAGGHVTANPEEAKIIVGRGGVKEVWILDSITNGKLQPLEQYSKTKCMNQ